MVWSGYMRKWANCWTHTFFSGTMLVTYLSDTYTVAHSHMKTRSDRAIIIFTYTWCCKRLLQCSSYTGPEIINETDDYKCDPTEHPYLLPHGTGPGWLGPARKAWWPRLAASSTQTGGLLACSAQGGYNRSIVKVHACIAWLIVWINNLLSPEYGFCRPSESKLVAVPSPA